ncbi:uncharacterized protein B0H64DRAFT_475742 [Chaetomium fimeti]|uniref:Uncharacterized protein n=1 Tax=Chaetomium fimeti TaxID=1854472 RepID=A0AAE0HD40_9PEZI|nr:hypothetical protein B0H64DRAFT_475742 [Chaetomium fimeti]
MDGYIYDPTTDQWDQHPLGTVPYSDPSDSYNQALNESLLSSYDYHANPHYPSTIGDIDVRDTRDPGSNVPAYWDPTEHGSSNHFPTRGYVWRSDPRSSDGSSTAISSPSEAEAEADANHISPTRSEHSEESHYSLSTLSPTNPHRRVRASEVREQANAIPRRTHAGPGYPHHFANAERLPLEHNNRRDLIEYPLMADGQGPWHPGQRRGPGPARIIVNQADRSSAPEVVYHDPASPVEGGRKGKPFAKASYRKRGELG